MPAVDHLLPPRYRDVGPIARGGMGEIFRATDEELGREVAVKVLAARYAADESLRARFKREALAAARLSGNPNIVTIFDVAEHEGRPLIVMEYMAGGSLEERLVERPAVRPGAGARLARAGGRRARRGARGGHRPSRREAREPAARRPRPGQGRGLRHRERRRHGLVHADRDDPRHRRLPVARAGGGRARHAGERPLRAGRRRLGAPDRPAPVRVGSPDRRGGRARPNAGAVGARREPGATGRVRRDLRARAREGRRARATRAPPSSSGTCAAHCATTAGETAIEPAAPSSGDAAPRRRALAAPAPRRGWSSPRASPPRAPAVAAARSRASQQLTVRAHGHEPRRHRAPRPSPWRRLPPRRSTAPSTTSSASPERRAS